MTPKKICNCKFCKDNKRIQTTKEIGENYNYSCFNHTARSNLRWILLSKHNKLMIEKDIALKEQAKEYEKIFISLAYQKVNGKLKRVNINHLDIIKQTTKEER